MRSMLKRWLRRSWVDHVSLGPMGRAIVVIAKPAQQGEETCFRAAEVVDGIGAGAAQIADGLVGAVGDVDRNEVVGTEVFGQLHGVAFVGFDAVAGLRGNQRGGDDIAANAHLFKSAGDPEAASAGLVADVEVGKLALLAFGNAAEGPLKTMLAGCDAAVVAGLGIAIRFEDGDDSFRFMDVEADVECARCA